jgi:hypothetical protein
LDAINAAIGKPGETLAFMRDFGSNEPTPAIWTAWDERDNMQKWAEKEEKLYDLGARQRAKHTHDAPSHSLTAAFDFRSM